MRLLVRVLTAASLAAALSGLGLAGPAPARADDVATAQARVDRLQGLVTSTTAKLVEGTKLWEQDRASLRGVELQLKNTRRHILEAQQVVDAGTARVSGLARRLYMSPTAGGLELAFTKSPAQIMGALEARDALDAVAGGDAQIVLRAQTARLRLRGQERTADQLARAARSLADRSSTRLQQLQALAQDTADQLVAAQNALQGARAARDARLAQLARDRAAARRAHYSYAGGPACTGRSTAGQQNGNLDPASLCPLWMAPGERLRADAAAAFNKMSRYHAATVGGPLCVTDSYRTYSEQVALYRSKPGLAAVPGTSEHGWGKAVDFCGGVQNPGSAATRWMEAHAGNFGWFHPDWAKPSGSKPEAWHWEFAG